MIIEFPTPKKPNGTSSEDSNDLELWLKESKISFSKFTENELKSKDPNCLPSTLRKMMIRTGGFN